MVYFMLFFDSKAAYMKAFLYIYIYKIKPDQTTCVSCEGGCPSADPLSAFQAAFCSFNRSGSVSSP